MPLKRTLFSTGTALIFSAVYGIPTLAEEPLIYTPCLTAHAALADYVSEMEILGWNVLEEGSAEWTQAAATVAQPGFAVVRMARAFEGLADVSEYLDRSARWGEGEYGSSAQVFQRDDVSAVVQFLRYSETSASLSCVFASSSLPDAAEILGDRSAPARLAFASGLASLDEAEEAEGLRVSAIRFDGSPLLTAMLTGREAVIVSWRMEHDE